jgi:hypothetical protein
MLLLTILWRISSFLLVSERIIFLNEHHTMEGYWESGIIGPRIFDVDTRWRWGVSFMLRPLYPQEKSHWCPLNRRVDGPQSRSGRGGVEKNSRPLPGLEPPIIQPVAQRYTTELSRLCILSLHFIKYSPHRKMFQTRILYFNEVFVSSRVHFFLPRAAFEKTKFDLGFA